LVGKERDQVEEGSRGVLGGGQKKKVKTGRGREGPRATRRRAIYKAMKKDRAEKKVFGAHAHQKKGWGNLLLAEKERGEGVVSRGYEE